MLGFAVYYIQDVDGTVGNGEHAFTNLLALSDEFGDTQLHLTQIIYLFDQYLTSR